MSASLFSPLVMKPKIIAHNTGIVKNFGTLWMIVTEDCCFCAMCTKKAIPSLGVVFIFSVNVT